MNVYTDLSLVFWNALFYNEAESQIAQDAVTLKVRSVLFFVFFARTLHTYLSSGHFGQ